MTDDTCARCPTALADVHAEPAGYVVETVEGEILCPDCAGARCGVEIGFGQCERENCPHCDDGQEVPDEGGRRP